MQRGKGLPEREGVRHGVSHLPFGSDTGDLSKLEQSHDPDERLLPSAKGKNVSFLESQIQSSALTWPRCTGLTMNFRVKSVAKGTPLPKYFQMSTRVMLMISFFPPFSPASLPLLTHKASLHPR